MVRIGKTGRVDHPRGWAFAAGMLVLLLLVGDAGALDGLALRNNTRWYDTGDVVLVDTATGQASTVVSGGGCFGYCFSPDGTRIAFWRDGRIFTVLLDGSDQQEICETYSPDYQEQYLSWALDGHIYWSERSPYIYRVDVATGVREIAHTSPNGDIRLAKVSLDGRHAGCTRNEGSWRAWAIDLEAHEERDLGDGCQATASPDGSLLTHNLPGHQSANIHLFSDLSVHRVIHKPSERSEFDMHEFSHSSSRHVVYTCDADFAYVHDIETDTPTFIGRGAPFDFRASTQEPHLGLQPPHLAYRAVENAAPPAAQDVAVVNLGAGTLEPVTVQVDAPWLTVITTGAGNGQILTNQVAHAGLTPATYTTDVIVSCPNAGNSPATFAVELVVEPDSGPVNTAPVVDAGPNVTVEFGMPAWLDGTVTDDGLPDGTLELLWEIRSGPGPVTIQDPDAEDTEIRFDLPGVYVLSLTASDGELQTSDQVTLTVVERGEPSITIVNPAGGEVLDVGSTFTIEWTAANLDDVAIRYSTDGGATMAGLIDDNVDRDDPAWGAYPWVVPDTPSTRCVVMISGYFNEAPTQSAVFEIRRPDSGDGPVQGGCGCGQPADGTGWPCLLLLVLLLPRRTGRTPAPRSIVPVLMSAVFWLLPACTGNIESAGDAGVADDGDAGAADAEPADPGDPGGDPGGDSGGDPGADPGGDPGADTGEDAGGPGTILFFEHFEDADFESRGWYDGPRGDLSSTEHIPNSTRSFECFFEQGQQGCRGGSPARHEFAETETVYLSYWVKYSSNYVGSQRPYHPHEFHFVTNQDDAYVGPANSHLTTYTEQVGGVVRIALQDSRNNDMNCILLNDDSFVGCNGDFNSYVFSEDRSVCSCNGLVGDLDGRDCYSTGSGYYSARFWDSQNQMFRDEPGAYYKNDWHFIECYFQMNSIQGGIGVADGVIQYWYDGELIIDLHHILMRTGQYADMRFDQFLIAPYIGDGSPVDQIMWVDDLTVATDRP